MRSWIVAVAFCAVAGSASAESSPRQDAMLGRYFALWDDNASVTPDTIAKLYAPQVVYYGHPMTRADLYKDKLGFIRQWPRRSYRVEAGSASRRCDSAETLCTFSAVLRWQRINAAGARAGRARVSLTVAQGDGGMKIVREGAVTLGN